MTILYCYNSIYYIISKIFFFKRLSEYVSLQYYGFDAIHFFLECCLYVEAREQLTNNLQYLDSLLIETLLFGDDSLSE